MTSLTITALLAVAIAPSPEITIGEFTPVSRAPLPCCVIFSPAGFDDSVDPLSKPDRSDPSRTATAETSVFPAGSPFGGGDVVQIVVVRPTSGARFPLTAGGSGRNNVPPPRSSKTPQRAAPRASARRPVSVDLPRRRSDITPAPRVSRRAEPSWLDHVPPAARSLVRRAPPRPAAPNLVRAAATA